jgi:hypothetical protein
MVPSSRAETAMINARDMVIHLQVMYIPIISD